MKKDLYLLMIGERLRQRREAVRLTLAQVSRRSGVTIAHLSRVENGLTDPRLSTLQRVLDAIGADLSAIAVTPPKIVPVEAALMRRAAGRERLDDSGVGVSEPGDRLDRKEQMGIDVGSERSALEPA
ncbi:MAG: helix-turn-helix transcriptional regulator [Actinomycetota bacterium]